MNVGKSVLLWTLTVLFLTGCAPLLVVGVTTSGSQMVGERRGADEYVDDNWVAMKIRTAYLQSESVHAGNVNVTVYRGRVLLTGTSVSESEVAEAIRLAKTTRGVNQVVSELKVQYISATELAKDAWITSKVKTNILADSLVRGLDIHVETTKAIVYMVGTAATVKERDHAIEITRNIDGVREVVSYIEVDPKSRPVTKHPSPPADNGPPKI